MKRNVKDTGGTFEEGGQKLWRSEPASHFPACHTVFDGRKEARKGEEGEEEEGRSDQGAVL